MPAQARTPLHVFSGGFLRRGRVRRILELAGYAPRLGWPRQDDLVAVWGRSPYAARGERVAARTGADLIRVEDAFIRSLRPGRAGDPPIGLLIDTEGGVHFDSATPSMVERILATDPLDDAALLARAHDAMARMIASDLAKYNAHDRELAVPEPGYVLVIDQLREDASIRHGAANARSFREMLVFAQEENPGTRIVIKTHPETIGGYRPGHYGPEDAAPDHITLLDGPVSPWKLLDGAVGVYTVSSQLGFEAILAGHKPRVFGQPFYAGWGRTIDENPVPRRNRTLTRAQLFAGAMLIAPTWYDPCRDRLCRFEHVLDQLEAETRCLREDRRGHVALGMRMWKRASLQAMFGRHRRLRFAATPQRALRLAQREGRGVLVWAGAETPTLTRAADGIGIPVRRVEDGFVRSRGLGAALTPALSLVSDDLGIYYDPTRRSRFEEMMLSRMPPGGAARAERLIRALTRGGLSKYNLGAAALPELPKGRRILVPGQVEDDASIRLGAAEVRTNRALLAHARAQNPDAFILYKPHPDVEAGLRMGAIPAAEAAAQADLVLDGIDPAVLLPHIDEVWTMTSLLGFEALLRGCAVTCLGAPFYAGWGLTRDLGPVPARRKTPPGVEPPDLLRLVHAALIGYPRYRDPLSGRPCPPEVVAERLAHGATPRAGPALRVLSRLQGLAATHAYLWR